jgi:hypothetical protein
LIPLRQLKQIWLEQEQQLGQFTLVKVLAGKVVGWELELKLIAYVLLIF